ncbi:MAG: phosphotransferase, partial [Acidimicrobiales bacterium]
QAGFSVVIQDVVIGPVLAEYIAAIHSRPLVAVVLTPRPDVVVQREADRRKVAYRDGFARVSDLDLALRRETPRIGMWLDSSDQQPDATVNEIIERGLDAGRIE